jgi:hypothetical protein
MQRRSEEELKELCKKMGMWYGKERT